MRAPEKGLWCMLIGVTSPLPFEQEDADGLVAILDIHLRARHLSDGKVLAKDLLKLALY